MQTCRHTRWRAVLAGVPKDVRNLIYLHKGWFQPRRREHDPIIWPNLTRHSGQLNLR